MQLHFLMRWAIRRKTSANLLGFSDSEPQCLPGILEVSAEKQTAHTMDVYNTHTDIYVHALDAH